MEPGCSTHTIFDSSKIPPTSINPYEPPRVPPEHWTTGESSTPAFKLYTPGHMAWATFLGAPLAGSVLLAINYQRLGESSLAMKSIAVGALVTIATCVVGFFLPDNVPNLVIPLGLTFGMWGVGQGLQGQRLDQHFASGGQKASAWGATGIGLLSLVVMIVVIFAAVVMFLPDELFTE